MKFSIGACSLAAAGMLSTTALSSSIKTPSRRTAPGDFQEFNKIFENASILIPENYEVSERVVGVNLNMNIRNIKCYDISVGDMTVEHDQLSSTEYEVSIGLNQLDLTCEMDYDYVYGVLSGDGWVQIKTNDNMATSALKFTSTDFDKEPPKDSTIEQCVSDVQIERLDFEEDLASEILEIFQGLIRGVVENAVGKVACDELSAIGTTLVGNMIELAETNLEPYRGNLGEAVTDPLYLERNLDTPDNLTPLNLQDTEGYVGKVFNQLLHFFDTSLGTTITDPDASTLTGEDLAVNVFLRSLFLDEERAFTVDVSNLPITSPTLFEGHDRITQFTVTLNQVRILGLDTLTRFNPFRNIGRHTIQNELTWDSLTAQFDVTVDIKPSTLDDAILQDPTSPGISERITIDFTVENVDVEASLLLVLDEVVLGSMELGPLFYTEHILPCVLSVVHEVKLSGFDVDPSYINEPAISGFLSPGLDRVVTDAVVAAFDMYSGALRDAIPNIFQTSVREIINSALLDSYTQDKGNSYCPDIEPIDSGYIDLNKFFNTEKMPYGDVPPMLKENLDNELLSINPRTGRPRINEVLVAPFTKLQSGSAGTLSFPLDLASVFLTDSVSKFGIDTLGFRVFDPKVENMDTMDAPIELFVPNSTKAFVFDNYATLGTDQRKLRFGVKGLLATEGEPSFAMSNEMDISVELAGSDAWVSLMAKVNATSLFNFPIRDITNVHCWLNTLATPAFLGESEQTGFSIRSLLLSTSLTNFNVSCTSCTSPSLVVLPEVLGSFKDYGISNVLERRLVNLGLDLLRSDFTQAYMNSILMDAKLRCPHSPTYTGPDVSSVSPSLKLPSLPYEALETVALASTLILEIGVVVAAEAHESYDMDTTAPLSGQNKLTGTEEKHLIDFTSLDTSVGEWAKSGIEYIIGYLNEVVPDPNNPDSSDLRVNTLLRSSLLSDTGYFLMAMEELGIAGAGMEVSFKELNIVGLDTISELNILNAIAPQTLQNEVTWKNLGINAVVSLMSTSDHNGRNLKTKHDISVSIELSDVSLSLSMLMAMDLDLLGSLKMGSMMEVNKILSCLLTAAHAASITEFDVTVGTISNFAVDGFQSNEVQNAANDSTRLILEKYGTKIISSIPKFFDSTVRTLINKWMEYNIKGLPGGGCLSSPLDSVGSGFVDLRDLLWTATMAQDFGGSGLSQYGNLFRVVVGFVRDIFKVNEFTGLSGLNDAVVAPLTLLNSKEAGTVYQTSDLFNGGTQVKVGALNADVHFRAYDAKIENLDTIGSPLQLFGGVRGEPYELNNTMTFGVGESPLTFSSKLLLSLNGDDDFQINNEMDLRLELFDANAILGTMAKISESRLFGFPLRDIFNLHCWLATIPAPALDSRGVRSRGSEATASLSNLDAHIGQLMMKAQCNNCSSPRMSELTDLLSDPATQKETTDVANALLNYVTQLMGGNFIQVQIDRLLNDAARKCPHNPAFDPDAAPVSYEAFESPDSSYSMSYLVLLSGLVIAAIIVVSLVFLFIRFIVQRRHKKWVQTLPPHQLKKLACQQKWETVQEDQLNHTTTSMFRSKQVPCIMKWLIPVIIVANAIFFLSGHLSLGATVSIEAEVAGEKFTIENFFEFSIARSTIDIWNAGGRELAILILMFSGIWPYTKLLMTFALWFLPPSRISVTRRGSILIWLDWLAKWSMVDIFVLVISIAAFRVSIENPDVTYLPEDFYSIEMMVIPLWGLYANMIAQMISQITSHVIIHYHRRIVAEASKSERVLGSSMQAQTAQAQDQENEVQAYRVDTEKGVDSIGSLETIPVAGSKPIDLEKSAEIKESLRQHRFGRPHRGETEKLVPRRYVDKLLLACAVCLGALVIVGCSLPSFSLELFGLVGVAVEFGQDFQEASAYHSVFSVVGLLFEQASYLGSAKDYIGLGVLSILFISTLLFVPIIQSIALLRQWFSTTTPMEKQRMAAYLEILQAWQYLEVYLVALFVSSWQLGPVSDSMINSYCENLENMFAQMVYYGILKEEDAQCFSVTANIENGAFSLVLGAILLSFLSSFVSKAAVQYFRDKKDQNGQSKEDDCQSTSFSDETSTSEDANEGAADAGFAGIIRPVPVLFTDSFRWMLRADNSFASSARALFGAHLSLPEATVIAEESSDNLDVPKGTYVRDLDGLDEKKVASMSRVSRSSQSSSRSLGNGKRLTNDKKNNEDYFSKSSCSYDKGRPNCSYKSDQQSIQSKMDSLSTSFKDEGSMISEAESLAYSLPSSIGQSVPSPPSPSRSRSSPTCSRKPPPPSSYQLSSTSLKKPNPPAPAPGSTMPFASSYADVEQGRRPTQNLKKAPPSPSLKKSNLKKPPQPMPREDDGEDYTQISFDETVNTDAFDEDRSHYSHRGLL